MKTVNLVLLSIGIMAVISCKENGEKPIDEAPHSNPTLIDQDNNAVPDHNTSSSSTATYTDNVEGTVDEFDSYNQNPDMSNMYKDLDMTDEQIQKYETASQKHQEIVESNKDVSRTLMKQRDKDMKSILSPSQYTKYKDMAKYYFKVGDSTTTDNQ